MNRFDATLLILVLVLLLALAVFHQRRIEALEANLELLRAGSGMGDASLIQRLNILERAFDLRLDYLEAGKVRPSTR